MSNTYYQNKDTNINLKDYLYVLLNRWYIPASICAVCLVFSFISTQFFTSPTYDSMAKIYIRNKESESINTNDISVSTYLAKDYEELIVDRSVLEEVIESLDMKTSYEQLKSAVKVNNPENTRIIEITVRTTSAENSKKIADCICNIAQEKIVDLMGIDRVSIIRNGNLPSQKSSPILRLNLLKALLVGLGVSLCIVLVIYLRDDKINGPADIEKYLEISVLGTIPYNKNRSGSKT